MADVKNYKIYENTQFEVLTEDGFKDFKGIIVGENKNKIKLTFDNGISLCCTPKHKIMINKKDYKYAKDLVKNDIVFNGYKLIKKEVFESNQLVYELLHVDGNHTYFICNLLSSNCLIIDEMAHIQSHLIDEFWGSVIPAISSSRKTKIFAVSTPNGAGDKFHEIFSGAESGKLNEWKAGKIYWWDIPGRGKRWQKEMLEALGGDLNLFKQEFENFFLESGESVINIELYEKLQANLSEPLMKFDNDNYRLWEEPKPGQIYAIGVDVGEGIGRAASVAQVLNITDLTNIRQAAIYRNNMLDPTYFAEILNRIGNHWGRPLMLIERNNCGAETITALKTVHKYTNIVSYGLDDSDIREGIYSNTSVKYTGVMNMRYWVNGVQSVIINDYTTLSELKTFVKYPNGTWKKKPGKDIYDDCVMSLIWGLLVLIEKIVTGYFDVAEYDERGKPLKIIPYEVCPPEFFSLDPFFQQYDEAPLPTLINQGTPDTGPGGLNELLMKDWNYL
jgi:hypothetical protein